ncbi:hypothetical protein Poli38472_010312 [Pythium oligandrum]|uniref:carbonic anhydrase n=1 Tax=Pythium oligandrum TaxID=41045 RepID=A0A8K1C2W2_PYTOL|nr:hypothetical protein Poli38472_010312 [Pythium oligandrum]|eukprot:TMW55430.1 hypothetical protein Poli38472_010312 [Pythium oligandrum]
MKIFSLLASVACLGAVVRADGAPQDGQKAWSYKTNDPSVYSPAEWGIANPNCNGKRQSPIDIKTKDLCESEHEAKKLPFEFKGECSEYHLKQLYDAHKAEVMHGSCSVVAKGKEFKFAQVHFHAPAEHTINGKVHDGEVHFVHLADDGNALVVGLFLDAKKDATTPPFLSGFWDRLEGVNTTNAVDFELESFYPLVQDAASRQRVFNYPGSLTAPKCDEIVDWFVVEKPLAISEEDLSNFQSHLKRIEASDDGRTARPTQPLNGRTVLVY